MDQQYDRVNHINYIHLSTMIIDNNDMLPGMCYHASGYEAHIIYFQRIGSNEDQRKYWHDYGSGIAIILQIQQLLYFINNYQNLIKFPEIVTGNS